MILTHSIILNDFIVSFFLSTFETKLCQHNTGLAKSTLHHIQEHLVGSRAGIGPRHLCCCCNWQNRCFSNSVWFAVDFCKCPVVSNKHQYVSVDRCCFQLYSPCMTSHYVVAVGKWYMSTACISLR